MDRQNFIEDSDITFIGSHLSPLCPHLSTITGLRAIKWIRFEGYLKRNTVSWYSNGNAMDLYTMGDWRFCKENQGISISTMAYL